MNTFPVRRQDGVVVTAGGWRFPLPPGARVPEGEITLGVRPEDLSLAAEGQPATVFVSEPLGNEVIVNVQVGDELVKLRAAPTVRPGRGDMVHVKADLTRLHVFDASGARLSSWPTSG
jgi:ABC-type sugar transport system ATPase subunit